MKEMKINNGLTIYKFQNTNIHSVAISAFFKAGLLYETRGEYGITHLVEHMFFRRMNHIAQKDLYFRYESIGGTLRGTTFRDAMRFSMIVSPKYFLEAMDIFRELFNDFVWTKEDIDKEKEVVYRQIELINDDYEGFINSFYYRDSLLDYPIMGSESGIRRLSVKKINSWKNRIVNTSNCCLVVTGNFSDEDFDFGINKFEVIENRETEKLVPSDINIVDFCSRDAKSNHIIDVDSVVSDICIIFDIESGKHSAYIMDFVNNILGVGDGSRLSYVLKDMYGITDDIFSSFENVLGFFRLKITFSVKNENIEQALKLCFDEILKMKVDVSDDDMRASRVHLTDNQNWLLDSSEDLNFFIGWNAYISGQGDVGVDKLIEGYSSVVKEDIISACRDVFCGKNLFVLVSNNKKMYGKAKLERLLGDLRESLN